MGKYVLAHSWASSLLPFSPSTVDRSHIMDPKSNVPSDDVKRTAIRIYAVCATALAIADDDDAWLWIAAHFALDSS